ncbi:MAG: hypothetical protein H0Z37_05720 [Firmicutes bacterium]|nr:hypothetical protein [Bacillota bacterium]
MGAVLVAERMEMEKVKEKFFRLLDTDRTSAEFERLYREVDAALAELVRAEGTPLAGR